MSRMKKHILFLFFLILFGLFESQKVHGQKLHAIIFADDGSSDGRQNDRMEDLKNLKKMMYDISKYAELELNLIVNTGVSFNSIKLSQAIRDIKVDNDDVVLFYYNGHGANEKRDKWPSISLNNGLLSLSDIHKALCASNAKLIISVGDCCNNFMNGLNENKPFSEYVYNNEKVEIGFKQLFKNFSGRKNIILSASSQGQFSYSDLKLGAIFGISFRESLYNATQNDNPTWDAVCNNAKFLSTQKQKQQIPQYEINSSEEKTKKTIYISDFLIDPQYSSENIITICGQKKMYSLDEKSKQITLTFPVENSEKCTYIINSRIQYYRLDRSGNKKFFIREATKEGIIEISDKKEYKIVGTLKGSFVEINLQKE